MDITTIGFDHAKTVFQVHGADDKGRPLLLWKLHCGRMLAFFAELGEALSEAERTQEVSNYVTAAIRLLLMTGCRLIEILTLRWEYLDMEGLCLRLPERAARI